MANKTINQLTDMAAAPATVDIKNVIFTDIVGAGAGTWSGKGVSDGGNNSNITFNSFKFNG